MSVIQITLTVDARGLSCPLPIVRTAQAAKALAPGSVIELLATDAGSVKDVAAWCKATRHELIEQTVDAGTFRFVIRRTGGPS